MKLTEGLGREFRFIKRALSLLQRIAPVRSSSKSLVCDDFESVVDRYPHNIAIIFEGKSLTYTELDQMANRYAHWARGQKLKAGDTVAVFLPNRLEYIAIWLGLSKLGIVSALINSSLSGPGLAHCINISGAGTTIIDQSTFDTFTQVSGQLMRQHNIWVLDLNEAHEGDHIRSLNRQLRGASLVRPEAQLREDLSADATALYIYTSGTTGLPKAARISNARVQLYMQAFASISQMSDKDRLYICLPLYHSTGGLCGVGAALMNGGAIVLKRKFSASQFWADIKSESCTHLVYIGELCRYLINSDQAADPKDETDHKLRLAFGNGMRHEVWTRFQTRFKVPEIQEFYGSTEGNVNLFNFDGKPGAIGRVPKYLKSRFNIRLVKFDIDQELPERTLNGLCLECSHGDIGEAIGAITQEASRSYSGYADRAASEKKILRDVFKKGDTWFRTGDLMRQDRDGYFYFVDRIGDTFRFKGENVSTTEVGEVASAFHGVEEATAYGVEVPHHDGKAGMLAISISDGFEISTYGTYLKEKLATYAQPRFIRILSQDLDTTGTFKYKKNDLVKQGFDPSVLSDMVYILVAETYIPLSKELMAELEGGRLRL